MAPKDELFQRQMDIAIDFLIHYNTYTILKDSLNKLEKSRLFWIITNNAHVRLMIACWAKIYGSNADDTHWSKVLCDEREREVYRTDLLETLGITELEWQDYWKAMRKCRDKFIAHTEFEYNDPIPSFSIAYSSIVFYIEWMKRYFLKKGICYDDDFNEYIEPYLIELKENLAKAVLY